MNTDTKLTSDQIDAFLSEQSDLVDELDQLNADYRKWNFGEEQERLQGEIDRVERRLSYVSRQLEY